jgi:hypothetical protein
VRIPGSARCGRSAAREPPRARSPGSHWPVAPVALSVVSSQHSGPFDPEGPSHHQSVRASV